jgi:ribonuclease HII
MVDAPTLRHERALRRRGYRLIAGLDEAGRGAWAGPVVAAAVVLPDWPLARLRAALPGLNDSKLLSPARREALRARILDVAVAASVAGAGPQEIDTVGIVHATRRAMQRALAGLGAAPDALLIDALPLPDIALPQDVFDHADARSCSVAAASILAKCARDAFLARLDAAYPGYGFAQHKGYGTRVHAAALYDLGISPVHRVSFAPVARCV